MSKDHIRDYATEAFRFYAKTGGSKKYIEKIVEDIQRQKGTGTVNPTEGALIAKERVIEENAAELADLEAVEKAIYLIEQLPQGGSILKVVEYVYFKDCWRELRKGDIENRVHYAEIHIPASRRQIYYWLKKAREIFAEERGLRT
jgi:hypothetical protein